MNIHGNVGILLRSTVCLVPWHWRVCSSSKRTRWSVRWMEWRRERLLCELHSHVDIAVCAFVWCTWVHLGICSLTSWNHFLIVHLRLLYMSSWWDTPLSEGQAVDQHCASLVLVSQTSLSHSLFSVKCSYEGIGDSPSSPWCHLGDWSVGCQPLHYCLCMDLPLPQCLPSEYWKTQLHRRILFLWLYVNRANCMLPSCSSQGAFIFFFHVVRHDKVWPRLVKCFSHCRKGKAAVTEDSVSSTSFLLCTHITHPCTHMRTCIVCVSSFPCAADFKEE